MGFLKNVKYAYKKCVYKIDETREHFCSTEGVKRVESDKMANKTFLLEKEHKLLVSKWDALDWYNDKGLVLGFDLGGRKRYALIDKNGKILGENGEKEGKKVYYKKIMDADSVMFDDSNIMFLIEENTSQIYRLDTSDGSILSKFKTVDGFSYKLKLTDDEAEPIYLTDGGAEGKIFLLLEDLTGGSVLVDTESESVAFVSGPEEINRYSADCHEFLVYEDRRGREGVIISIKGTPSWCQNVDADLVRKLLNDHRDIVNLYDNLYESKSKMEVYVKIARESARRELLRNGKNWSAEERKAFKHELDELGVVLEKKMQEGQERKRINEENKKQTNDEVKEIEEKIDVFGDPEKFSDYQNARLRQEKEGVKVVVENVKI